MTAAGILYFQVMSIWPFRRVDCVAFVFCTKFGSNICYSHDCKMVPEKRIVRETSVRE